MRIETSLKRRDSAISSLRDTYASALHCRPLHSALQSDVMRIRSTLNGAPDWTRQFFDGYAKALADSLYQGALVHGGFLGGDFYSTDSKRPDYYGNFMQANVWSDETRPSGKVTGLGHYWRELPEPGRVLVRPYFTQSES